MDRRIASSDLGSPPRRGAACVLLLTALLVAACGRGPTEDVLRGGVPARTDLHRTTGLPPHAVRTVNRNDAGWRLSLIHI